MKFCSTDILSKMFGPAFQEGEGYAEGDKHILANPFPQEGEGHRVIWLIPPIHHYSIQYKYL